MEVSNWMVENSQWVVAAYVVAGIMGLGAAYMLLAKFFLGLKAAWTGLTWVGYAAKGVTKFVFGRRKATPQASSEPIKVASTITVRITEQNDSTLVTVTGPVCTLTESVKRHDFFNKRYNKRIKAAVARLKVAYNVRASLVTEGTDASAEWNPAEQWKSSDGKVTEVAALNDNHLTNIVKKIDRGDDVGLGHRVLPIIKARLKAEAERRGLVV